MPVHTLKIITGSRRHSITITGVDTIIFYPLQKPKFWLSIRSFFGVIAFTL